MLPSSSCPKLHNVVGQRPKRALADAWTSSALRACSPAFSVPTTTRSMAWPNWPAPRPPYTPRSASCTGRLPMGRSRSPTVARCCEYRTSGYIAARRPIGGAMMREIGGRHSSVPGSVFLS